MAITVGEIVIIVAGYMLCITLAALYVFKDSKKRGMNHRTWTIVTVFGPFLLGFIMYMVCRVPIEEYSCPQCGNKLTGEAGTCDTCKTIISRMCSVCGFMLKKEWKNCPGCGADIGENIKQPIKTYKKDNSTIPVIVIAVCVGIVFFAAIFIIQNTDEYTYTGSGYECACGMYNITSEDLSANDTIKQWIEECNQSEERIHILTSSACDSCIVYVKNCDKLLECYQFEFRDAGGVSTDAQIYICASEFEDKYGYDFFYFNFDNPDKCNISVFTELDNGRKVKKTVVDKDICKATWRKVIDE